MKRIMIIDNDSTYTKELCGFFCGNDTYEIVGNATDGDTALELIPCLNPDLIIMDLILPRTDGFSILKRYSTDEKIKIIIVSSLNNCDFVSKVLELGASYFMLKPVSPINLKENIDELFMSTEKNTKTSSIRYSNNTLDEKISNIFIQIGIPAHIKGYLFLREAIKITMSNLDMISSLTKKLYPQVAEHFNTSSCRVEKGIRHAIEIAWNKGRLTNINSIFGLFVYDNHDKPSNGELIALLADKLLFENSYEYKKMQNSLL